MLRELKRSAARAQSTRASSGTEAGPDPSPARHGRNGRDGKDATVSATVVTTDDQGTASWGFSQPFEVPPVVVATAVLPSALVPFTVALLDVSEESVAVVTSPATADVAVHLIAVPGSGDIVVTPEPDPNEG
jgi:hypothetical protein